MRKPAAYLFAILVGAVIWFFFQNFNIEGVQSVRVVPKEDGTGLTDAKSSLGVDIKIPEVFARNSKKVKPPATPAHLELGPKRSSETIRVAGSTSRASRGLLAILPSRHYTRPPCRSGRTSTSWRAATWTSGRTR